MSALFKLKNHPQENRLFLNRTVSATIFVSLLSVLLLSRQFYLQIYEHEKFVTMARNNQVRIVPVPPTRGLIFDRNGVLLANNIPDYSLEAIPNRVHDLKKLVTSLRSVINISDQDVEFFKKQIKYKGRFDSIPLKNKLSEEEVAMFALECYRFPDVEVVAHLSRSYPFGESMSHVLGYIGPISESDLTSIDLKTYRGTNVIGKSGIEKFYESQLLGEVGIEQLETDARGRVVRSLENMPSIRGHDLYLTIDSQLQKIAFDALGDRHGAVVMIEIESGDVITMASKPSFNPNLFIQGIDQDTYSKLQNDRSQPLFHRAIRGQYPPGSTVKPLVALQALDLNVVDAKHIFYDPGYYQIKDEGRLFRDWKPEGHGAVNMEKALAESCTTYFYYVAEKLGIDRIHAIFNQFGLGQLTSIDIHGEARGIAPSQEWKRNIKRQSWYPGETLITGIGQGFTLVTPLQMANVASIIAQRGNRVKPHLLKSMQTHAAENVLYIPETLEPIKINNPKNWDIIINGMTQVVKSKYGTAHRIYRPNDEYKIAGKTGTSQVFGLKQDEKYDADKIQDILKDHSSFIAFAPIENPKVAIAVIVEHGRGSPEIAKLMLNEYFKGTKS
jgi:penicillin-binding protein 2